MTKQQVEQKIKEILEKDKRFIGATIEIKFKDKNKNEEIITASIGTKKKSSRYKSTCNVSYSIN